MVTQALIAATATKKAELDRLRDRALGAATIFDHSQDLELTYTANAIEGTTLTAVETTMAIAQGLTVAGKPFKDHLEALDHFEAIRYVRDQAQRRPRPAAPPPSAQRRQQSPSLDSPYGGALAS